MNHMFLFYEQNYLSSILFTIDQYLVEVTHTYLCKAKYGVLRSK